MKQFSVFFLLLSLAVSCSKKQVQSIPLSENDSKPAPYDTTAVDSFSAGAVSVDVARQIRMSSKKYIDSVKKAKDSMKLVLQIQEEERKKKEAEEKANAEKEKEKEVTETISEPKP